MGTKAAETDRDPFQIESLLNALAVASNHPHGLLDGLLVASAIGAVRGDVRMLIVGRGWGRVVGSSRVTAHPEPVEDSG